jgi:hypothetical protein
MQNPAFGETRENGRMLPFGRNISVRQRTYDFFTIEQIHNPESGVRTGEQAVLFNGTYYKRASRKQERRGETEGMTPSEPETSWLHLGLSGGGEID